MVIGRAKYVPLAEMVATEATDKYIATMEKEADLDVSEVKMTVNKIADGIFQKQRLMLLRCMLSRSKLCMTDRLPSEAKGRTRCCFQLLDSGF